GAVISWKQTSDRFAATWQKLVNGYNGKYTNYFQIEMFFSGLVRITILSAHEDSTTVGLSRGTGFPPDFIDTEFSAKPNCASILPDLFVPPRVRRKKECFSALGLAGSACSRPLPRIWLCRCPRATLPKSPCRPASLFRRGPPARSSTSMSWMICFWTA